MRERELASPLGSDGSARDLSAESAESAVKSAAESAAGAVADPPLELQAPVPVQKPARLNALTGLRCFAAVNIVLFHFSNPLWFGWLAPVVNAGYASVSFFILLSGFVMAYNYAERARAGQLDLKRFYKARFTRLYPIYLLGLLLSLQILGLEYSAHTHGMFWAGVVLTPLLLQGWVPALTTFWNTPAWTMSAETFFYILFPWCAQWKKPAHVRPHLLTMGAVWCIGMIPGTLYFLLNPDGIAHPDRWSSAPWLQALKFTPLAHLSSFIFGVLLASLDAMMPRISRMRFVLGIAGFVMLFGVLELGPRVPYVIIHDGLLMPLFGCIILGLAGENPLARLFGMRPLVFIGEASYCLYLLHFNLWNLIHTSHVLNDLHLSRFDPWISYVLLVGLALIALHFVEKPAQRQLRRWMGA